LLNVESNEKMKFEWTHMAARFWIGKP
jgi:hypothetical protein